MAVNICSERIAYHPYLPGFQLFEHKNTGYRFVRLETSFEEI